MRANLTPVLVAILVSQGLVACGGGGGGAGDAGVARGGAGDGGGQGVDGAGGTGAGALNAAAWSDGPAGHVYVYSGPLYDIDAHDGKILRQITAPSVAMTMQANADHAYFVKPDAQGKGRVFQLSTASNDISMLSMVSNNLLGVYKRELIGQLNGSKVVRVNLDTGVDTQTNFPGVVTCESGSIFEHTLLLVCLQIKASGSDAALLSYDLDTGTFAPLVVVKAGVQPLSLASNVNGTPSGVIFTLYEGQASAGTRTAYKINGTTVSAGVPIAGTANDLDPQASIGNVLYIALNPDNKIVPFDATTMTAGTTIAIDRPRRLRAGGGVLWASSKGHDGQLAKINPATGEIKYRTFERLVSAELNAVAFGGS